MIQDVLAFAARHTADGKKAALVTVTATHGSSPASPGQVMAVLSDGTSAGTVGGGESEHRLIKQAVQAIKNGSAVFRFSFDHAEHGMSCGGGMEGFINVLGSQAGLAIFGGGHIAQSLAKIAALTGFFVTVIEDRREFAECFDSARFVICNPEEYEKSDPVAGCDYAVICTRGHETDAEALRWCLKKPLKYTGMIGSAAKVKEVMAKMRGESVPQELLDKVYAPIGLNIADEAPAEIAVAILSEILLVKNTGTLEHKRTHLPKPQLG
ncbi:MAG: XdhC/CoxI family protein [Treponema sp.]|nr:XdhC/CoxI family protein [Treponema sp.]